LSSSSFFLVVLPRRSRWVPLDSRTYRYFFARRGLDLSAMEAAATKMVGDRDFRNLCKLDAANVSNFRCLNDSCTLGHRIGPKRWCQDSKRWRFIKMVFHSFDVVHFL
jgi:tRNA U38,U39,U40 pseudouridine synthase TruA